MNKQEQGSAMALFLVACWTLILMGLMIGADYGRLFLFRTQVETATDAAALAGAGMVDRWVAITVTRSWTEQEDCTEEEKTRIHCPRRVTYTETVTQPHKYPYVEWQRDLCNAPYRCLSHRWECWLEPKNGTWESARATAERFFWLNAQGKEWADHVQLPVTIDMARDTGQRNWSWFYVRVRANVDIPMLLGDTHGKSTMRVSRLNTTGEGNEGGIEAVARPTLRAALGENPTEPPLVCRGMEAW